MQKMKAAQGPAAPTVAGPLSSQPQAGGQLLAAHLTVDVQSLGLQAGRCRSSHLPAGVIFRAVGLRLQPVCTKHFSLLQHEPDGGCQEHDTAAGSLQLWHQFSDEHGGNERFAAACSQQAKGPDNSIPCIPGLQ